MTDDAPRETLRLRFAPDSMRLSDLVAGLADLPPGADADIAGVSEDSRKISEGMVFVAVPGAALDGHTFVDDAIERGAAAIVAERPVAAPVPVLRVASARVALAAIAARFHRNPASSLQMIGFTGTFGKTSTSDVLRQLLDANGRHCGVLGSLGARYRDFHHAGTGLTTPAPVELHASLDALRKAGADTVIMEVTSHALRMQRALGITFAGGLLAAIMPGEHTDFHRTYGDYVNAKRLFLDYLRRDALLAYDADNRAARTLAAEAQVGRRVGFSFSTAPATLRVDHVRLDAEGAHFTVNGMPMQSALLGRGHLRNVALALTYALNAGVSAPAARAVLRGLKPLRRRMERYDVDGRLVLDDTAAHPDSLRATFETAELLPHGRLAVVYAVRGSRGVEINQRNARVLADLTSIHGVDPFVVTAAVDATLPQDDVTDAERGATVAAVAERGGRCVFVERLDRAIAHVLDATRPRDLIVLLGAQGMNRGKDLLLSSTGRSSRTGSSSRS